MESVRDVSQHAQLVVVDVPVCTRDDAQIVQDLHPTRLGNALDGVTDSGFQVIQYFLALERMFSIQLCRVECVSLPSYENCLARTLS